MPGTSHRLYSGHRVQVSQYIPYCTCTYLTIVRCDYTTSSRSVQIRAALFPPSKLLQHATATPTGFQKKLLSRIFPHPSRTHIDACVRLVRDGDAHGTVATAAGLPLPRGRAASHLRGSVHAAGGLAASAGWRLAPLGRGAGLPAPPAGCTQRRASGARAGVYGGLLHGVTV